MAGSRAQSTAVAKIETRFPALASESDAMAAIAENLKGAHLTERDLERIQIPGAGATTWEVPTLEGDPISTKTIEGIVVAHRLTRAYFEKSFEDSDGSPPQCSSRDSVTGHGNPGGDCESCPFSQFGSSTKPNSNGQACQQLVRRQFFVLTDGYLPTVISAPASSLKPSLKYLMRLSSKGIKIGNVVTRFELEQRQDGGPNGNIKYAVLVLSMAERLEPDAIVKAEAYARTVRPIFDSMPVDDSQPDPADGE